MAAESRYPWQKSETMFFFSLTSPKFTHFLFNPVIVVNCDELLTFKNEYVSLKTNKMIK